MEDKLIILADDDDDDCFLIERALREAGVAHPLRRARDGGELLSMLREGARPALILLDLNMPGVSGRDALWAIKKDADLTATCVVVLTTSHSEDDAHLARTIADGFWRKPKRFEELVDVARRIGELIDLTFR
ncbi:MAG: response regulator [Elusimicrobia bacterium]|nr:response regulator [Elusimicrobiota bacterium]